MNRINQTTAMKTGLENKELVSLDRAAMEQIGGGAVQQPSGVVGIDTSGGGSGPSEGNFCGTPVHPGYGGPHTRS